MTSSHERGERPGSTQPGRPVLSPDAVAPEWVDAFTAVPRSEFLPRVMWPYDMATGESRVVDKQADHEGWLRWARADVPIVTQWDNGEHSGQHPGTVPTSSSSMPSVVATMLRDADVRPGMSVLEIGTGTGWTAALLVHRLGRSAVTTVEVDPAVCEEADRRLRQTGLRPTVICGDGALGYPPQALYDRTIATCGLRHIPFTWVEQTRPGGIILAPWGTQYSHQDASARLTVAADGTTASGPFTKPVQFMKLRSQRLTWPRHTDYVPEDWPESAAKSTTALAPSDISDGTFGPAEFAIGLAVPDCVHNIQPQGGDVYAGWFYSLSDRSWAAVAFRLPRQESDVYQMGPRRLWDEIEAAHRWWEEVGRPGYGRFGLTVTAHAQTPWLDSPSHPVPRVTSARDS